MHTKHKLKQNTQRSVSGDDENTTTETYAAKLLGLLPNITRLIYILSIFLKISGINHGNIE